MHVADVRVLVIDTSSETACVGVVDGGVVRAETSVRVSAQHGETLLPRVAQILETAGLARGAIDLVAVGLGPGSFTGVRIGLATAKGLALGLGKPIVGVRTSRVLAAAVAGALRVVAIDGKKGEVFASAWALDGSRLVCRLEDVHGAPEVAAARLRAVVGEGPLTVVGTGARAYPSFVPALGEAAASASSADDVVRAGVLAREACALLASGGPSDLARLEPVYVRPADALLPASRA